MSDPADRRPGTPAASPPAEPVLEATGLRKAFGGIRAVDDVAIRLAAGERRAVIGPNGAGKTTLFNLLTGHVVPDAGTVRFRGAAVSGAPVRRIWRLGLARTFQAPAVFPSLTVMENVEVACLSRSGHSRSLLGRGGARERPRAEALLRRVGLLDEADRPAAALAYGDRKRLEVGIALANDPAALLLDEPTAGLAPAERRALMALVTEIVRERGLALLFTEHDMDVVFAVAERITVLHQGRVIAEGAPAAVRADAEVQRVYLGEP